MDGEKLLQTKELLRIPVGSCRYGTVTSKSDRDIFILTSDVEQNIHDEDVNTTYFVWSVRKAQALWGNPLLLINMTGEASGNEDLCNFLRNHKHDIAYAAPGRSVIFGLEYVAVGERYGYTSPIKVGILLSMVLSHMAAEVEDPFLLNEEEKSILIRAGTGDISLEERVEIYRRTISSENINRLLRMPDHLTIENELFHLIEEIIRQS